MYSGPRGLYRENLSETGSYRYWLAACYAQKCSAVYSTAAVAIGRPAAPDNFQVRADQGGSDGRYTASWNNVDGATNYKLFHSLNVDIPGTQIYDGGALSQSLDLDDGSHYYQLQACAATGCSPFVKSAAGLRVLRAPGTPVISTPASSANGRYNVSWSVPADTAHVKYYQLQEGNSADFANATTSIEGASANSRAVSHSASESATYYYRVQACNQDGDISACSEYSNTASVSVVAPPGEPVNFSVPPTSSNGNFRISWDRGMGGTPENYTISTVVDACEYDYETRRNICTRLPGGSSITVSTPYADFSGLKDGTYQYTLQACNASGCSRSVYAGTVVVKLLAGVPGSLSVSPGTSSDGNYRLDWTKPEGPPASYQLFEAAGADFGNQRQIYEGNELSWPITGKNPNGTYWYRVRACNSAGCSAYADPASVRVAVSPGLPPALSASVSVTSDGNYRLTWGTAPGTPTYYQLVEATAADFSNEVQAYRDNSLTWSISGKTPNATYQYRVRACNDIGCGPYTSAVSVKVAVPPGIPTNVSMPASSNTGNFRISWSAGSGTPPTSYRVDGTTDQCEYDYETHRDICWRLPGGGSYTVSTPYVNINGLQEGTFNYSVRACDNTGCSVAASAGSIKVTLPPGAPASISASTSSTKTGSYGVSWGKASGSPTSYQLFETFNVSSNGETQVYAGAALSWSTSGKNPNGTYYYRARACNNSGCGPYTNAVSVEVAVTTLPGDNGNCPPRVRVCQIMQPDGLVFAMPPSHARTEVANSPQIAASGTHNVRTSRNATVTGHEDAAPEFKRRITALARARQRYARSALITATGNPLSEYSLAPGVYYASAGNSPPLRQDPRIQSRYHETNDSTAPQFELAANSKPAAAYAHMLQYSYDRTGHLSQLHEILPDNTVGTRYWAVADADAVGHITGEVFGNGMARAREFNAATGLQTGVNSGTRDSKLQDETYDWDGMGNLHTRRDGVTGLTESFDYDRLDRLTRVRTTAANVNAEVTTAYDAIGNIQNRDSVGRYTYNGSPYAHTQPHAVRTLVASDSTKRDYSYDANGNLTSGPGRTITWTSYNKPKTVNNA